MDSRTSPPPHTSRRSALSVQDLLNAPDASRPSHSSHSSPHSSHSSIPDPSSQKSTTRGRWRIDEDRMLMDLVTRYGPKQWSMIATHLPRRTGKQARERWMNQLDPALRRKNWTAKEDKIILHAHENLGNKWSAIAKKLPGRTDNSVKNHYNSTLKRAMRERSNSSTPPCIDDIVNSLHARPYTFPNMHIDNDTCYTPHPDHHSFKRSPPNPYSHSNASSNPASASPFTNTFHHDPRLPQSPPTFGADRMSYSQSRIPSKRSHPLPLHPVPRTTHSAYAQRLPLPSHAPHSINTSRHHHTRQSLPSFSNFSAQHTSSSRERYMHHP